MRFKHFAIVFLATICVVIGCMGSGGQTTGTTNGGATSGGGGTVNVTMDATMTFTPQLVNAHAGDTVKWTNIGAMPHTVTSDPSGATFDSSVNFPGGMQLNDVFTWTVPANATIGTHYFYHCAFHGAAGNGTSIGTGMAGEITVN